MSEEDQKKRNEKMTKLKTYPIIIETVIVSRLRERYLKIADKQYRMLSINE